ncbi:hypothetical protein RhiJN_15042 [Ceratobasidium sp. AG-Ba]|nr:hypothetical protein RhiJN_15042 [Ceratobasidium sp. AG-Ba]
MRQITKSGTTDVIVLTGDDAKDFDPRRILWSSSELMYRQYLQGERGESASDCRALLLPLARTSHIYAAVSIDLFRAFSRVHDTHAELVELLREVCVMESEGPIHNTTPLSVIAPKPSVHVSADNGSDDEKGIVPAKWLRAAFWDPASRIHASWRLSTFVSWVTEERPHVDRTTETVYGGPHGVRMIVFAISRILQNIERAASGSPAPRDVSKHFKTADLTGLRDSALGLIGKLREDVASSRHILRSSLKARQAALETEVCRLYRSRAGSGVLAATAANVAPTSGLPHNEDILEEMYDHICETQELNVDVQEDAEYEVAERIHESNMEFEETLEHIEITAILGDFELDDETADGTNILSGLSEQYDSNSTNPIPESCSGTGQANETPDVEMSPGNPHGGYPGHSLPASLPSCIPRRGREEEWP